ncbi:LysM peptidoglycan-binding domain-containing protein [Candidatus Fermentibacterales bacterium]|nr:LysM peptidoglycan-binding domain-containing protein [Candidatus Fermentibacterales bacterium]
MLLVWSSSVALLLASCSATRVAAQYDKEVDAGSAGGGRLEQRLEAPVLPALYSSGADQAWLDLDPSLASASQIQYDWRRFPAPDGLKELLESILVSEGVPADVAALPWVESDYYVGCHSRAGAAGPWQFIRETARDMDMRMDSLVDDRYSWVTATRMAGRYIRDMRSRLGDWTLALAAYNCGEGVVASRLGESCARFELSGLPGETQQFVPRVVAATLAYRQVPPSSSVLSVVWIPPDTDLRLLSARVGVHPDTLILLNRSFLQERTPPDGDGWELVVPSSLASRVFRAAWEMGDRRRYTVSTGESWSRIASSLGVSEEALRSSNPGAELIAGTRLQIPAPAREPVNMGYGGHEDFIVYIVRTGDTLSEIGATVGVSSREVALWNDMSPDAVIYPGQRLVLRAGGQLQGPEPPDDEQPVVLVTGGGRLEHVVSAGDTLWDLAVRYGVAVEQIMYLNSLESSVLHPGDVLLIRTE